MAKKVDMAPADLIEMADDIQRIADGYRDVAKRMDEKGYQTLAIVGIETTKKLLITRLAGNLTSVQRAMTYREQRKWEDDD